MYTASTPGPWKHPKWDLYSLPHSADHPKRLWKLCVNDETLLPWVPEGLCGTEVPLTHADWPLLRFILMWAIFKVFIEFVVILLLSYVLVFWPRGMWELSSPTRDQAHSPCTGRWSRHHPLSCQGSFDIKKKYSHTFVNLVPPPS